MTKTFAIIALLVISLALTSQVYASGESIDLDYPSEVTSGEKFSVSLELINFSSGTYDVKIDLLNSSGGRISEILNGAEWKSTFYYIVGAINANETASSSFKMNITKDYSGSATINVTIRGGSSYKFGPYSLDVEAAPESEEDTQTNPTNSSSDKEDTEEIVASSNSTLEGNENTDEEIVVVPVKNNSNKAAPKTLPESKTIKISEEASSDPATQEVVYESSEVKASTIAVYLAGILFVLVGGYLLASKGKI